MLKGEKALQNQKGNPEAPELGLHPYGKRLVGKCPEHLTQSSGDLGSGGRWRGDEKGQRVERSIQPRRGRSV